MIRPTPPATTALHLLPLEHPRWGRFLSALDLRYVLTDLICSPGDRVWSVAELVGALDDAGFVLSGRPSKEISDSLRWEVGRGRVRRVGRGRYVAGSMPGATRRRIRARARQLRVQAERAQWEEAAAGGGPPDPHVPYGAGR